MDNLWIGTEIEGPIRGVKTLFIGDGRVSLAVLKRILETENPQRVYFGAKETWLLPLNFYEIWPIVKEHFKPPYIFETTHSIGSIYYPSDVLNDLHIIMVLTGRFSNINVVKKVTDTQVKWYELEYPSVTDLNDPLYEKDRVIK